MNPRKLSIGFSLLLAQSSYAFTLNHPRKCCVTRVNSNRNCDDFVTKMSTVVAASTLATAIWSPECIAFVSPDSIAHDSDSVSVTSHTLKNDQREYILSSTTPSSIASSSLEIVESIKTLDMEMPSYGKIVSPTVSQDEIEGTEVKLKADKEGKKEKKTSSVQVVAKKNTKSSGPTADEKKAKAEAARAEKERKMEEKQSEALEIVGMDMPSYSVESGAKKSVFSF